MGYEERYKELFSKLVNARFDKSKKGCAFCTVIDSIMSELAESESEDERIRKELICYFEKYPSIVIGPFNTKECIAWLEKQGEQKPAEEYSFNIESELFHQLTLAQQGLWRKEIEQAYNAGADTQKPAWSEEDKEMSRFIGNAITADDASEYLESKAIQVIDAHVWLDGLKNRCVPQPKQEWSEEDDKMINSIAVHLNTTTGGFPEDRAWADKFMIWLKALKDRVVPQQKQEWSEEDKKMLDFAIRAVGLCKQYAINHQVNGYSKLPDVPKRYDELQDWLKSLKDRVQQQNKWKESLATADLENSLCDIQDGFSDTSYEYRILGEAIEFIRCNEQKPQWKPSEEQMKALKEACDEHWEPDGLDPLYTLWEQLKKLREEDI